MNLHPRIFEIGQEISFLQPFLSAAFLYSVTVHVRSLAVINNFAILKFAFLWRTQNSQIKYLANISVFTVFILIAHIYATIIPNIVKIASAVSEI